MLLFEGAVSLLLSCHNTPVFFTSCRVISRLGPKVFASCGIQTYQNWFLTTKFYLTYENFWQMTPKGNITHTAYRWFCKFSRKCNNTWHDVFFICCLNIVKIDFRIVCQWFFLINSWLLQHEKSVSGYDDTPEKKELWAIRPLGKKLLMPLPGSSHHHQFIRTNQSTYQNKTCK